MGWGDFQRQTFLWSSSLWTRDKFHLFPAVRIGRAFQSPGSDLTVLSAFKTWIFCFCFSFPELALLLLCFWDFCCAVYYGRSSSQRCQQALSSDSLENT